jgi:hypothetical protein
MKYLRLFETFEKSQFYEEITDAIYGKPFIDINPNVRKTIGPLLVSDCEFDTEGPKFWKMKCGYPDFLQIKKQIGWVDIFEIDDEWYFVKFVDIGESDKNYKCDQLEGLLQLLKDKCIIESTK